MSNRHYKKTRNYEEKNNSFVNKSIILSNSTCCDKKNEIIQPKFGPAPSFSHQRLWSRCILIPALVIIVWYNSGHKKQIIFAKQQDTVANRIKHVPCASDYTIELRKYPGCLPIKCGRMVTDNLISAQEIDTLLQLVMNAMDLGGSDGGATILDLHSGALSKGIKFINVYAFERASQIFNSDNFAIYNVVKNKIQHAVAHHFGVDESKIFLTKPTFFSRMTNTSAKTIHDEYWLPHVDKNTYEHFHYTSLLYLNDFRRDFDGGRFIFIDKDNVNMTIEPKRGRVSIFTSGAENLHFVERVNRGVRYALTVSFTCNVEAAIANPSYNKPRE